MTSSTASRGPQPEFVILTGLLAFCLLLLGVLAARFACQGNVSVFVYDNNDIVSGHLKGAGHDWEAVETQEMLWALRQFQDTRKVQLDLAAGSAAAAAAAAMQGGAVAALPVEVPDVPLVVDIGANVGWFTLNAAAAQAKVAAFEGRH